ncbi:MAG: GTP 3',8-cyclase MoaA [bacterium]|nr:GTP 3',8-cyclase MoaA [bacterium]
MARHRTLRLSVTDRCNLRCAYCLPSDSRSWTAKTKPLEITELIEIVSWLHSRRPFDRIKLTGGEPLLRHDLERLVERLSELGGEPELSMTTNGVLLAERADGLRAAGLARVNVSLDSLDSHRFREVSRGGDIDKTVAGIEVAHRAGLSPIKVNSVLRRSSWREDVPALLDFAAENRLTVRFIELMRTGTEQEWCAQERVAADDVLRWLDKRQDCTPLQGNKLSEHGAQPARRGRLMWRGREIEVGWILPVSRPFCSACDRLRLDAYGQLRRCLMDPAALSLTEHSSSASLDAELERFLAGKHPPTGMDNELPMAALGG